VARIVIDGNSLQARQHLAAVGSGRSVGRLSSFLKAFEEGGHTTTFCGCHLDLEEALAEAQLLIILTSRPSHDVDRILPIIKDFVGGGGGLFLLSNHSRVPGQPRMGNFTRQDGKIARIFGVKLLDACFRAASGRGPMVVDDTGLAVHAILQDGRGRRVVESVSVNNGCGIDRGSEGTPVLLLPENAVDMGPNSLSPHGHAFCWASESGGGRVVVTGDSGFAGEPDLPASGPGLFDRGDNKAFTQRVVEWLTQSAT
jgi:hypothetical protein